MLNGICANGFIAHSASALTCEGPVIIFDTDDTGTSDLTLRTFTFDERAKSTHIEQRTYGISTGTGSLELSMIRFSPEIFTSNATSETATPSEHEAITRTFVPSSCNDLTVHF